MSGLRRSWTRRTAQLTAVGLLAASGSMFFASTALAAAGGNNGTVLINGDAITNGNDPHITCPITFKWAGFDPAPTKDDYSVTVTGINPTGGTATFTAPTAGNPLTGTFTGPDFTLSGVQVQVNGGTANKKGEYHVNLTVETKAAKTTDTKSKTVWLANCQPAPTDLAVAGACSLTTAHVIDWTVTNPNSTDATGVSVQSNPAGFATSALSSTTIAANNGTATFTTAAPLPSGPPATTMGATGTVNGQTVHSTGGSWGGSSCPIAGAAENPASVTFSDDCTGTTVNFTSADQHTSTFTVTEPLGGTDTVNGTTSKHYDADAAHAHTVVTDDKNIVSSSHDWVDPGTCQQLAADPQTSEANHCQSGINLTLSNMNGTADVTFTLSFPNGSQEKELVRAGQLKKLTFAVKEDTTGSVTVTAPGLAKKTYSYKKNCATVLGVKHTRKPPHKPVVKGEHQQQLPFTGFDTKRALLGGSVAFFLGAVLCMLGARRREEELLYY
jgi:hypothetical protein